MNSLDLSIIIINWKSQAFVRECVASIYANTDTIAYEIFVVDNASYDGCEQMLKSEFPHAIFIQSDQNLGFSAANNLAFALSRGRNVLFLNPDTEIQGPAIQKLISGLESIPQAGMVGARLLNSDLSLQTTCITAVPSILNQTLNSDYLRRAFPKWKMWGMQALFGENDQPIRVKAISGACMLARREVIEHVGCFTTDYFMYVEDMDLCIKIEKTGWKIYYIPTAIIVHHAGGSSSSREESNFSNIALRESLIHFFTVHRGSLYAALYRGCMVFISMLRISLLVVLLIFIRANGYRPLFLSLSKWRGILAWSMGLIQSGNQQPQTRPSIMATTLEKLYEFIKATAIRL
jgi:N-acetylglucosaminyl-diphospho-decaprenol L-rhamnosyltransferase